MSWSYTDPTNSDLDAVRFLIGDTDTTDQQLSNEEINYFLTANSSSVHGAAAACCNALAAKYARAVDKSVGDLSLSYSQLHKNYTALYQQLRSAASAIMLAPYAGGISVSDKLSQERDSDRVSPSFRIGMHDLPNV